VGRARLAFPNDANRPYDKWKAGDAFRRTLKRAGLPHFRLYDLRHIYASLLLAAGAPITYVSAQLGHANPTTTLHHYAKCTRRTAGLVNRGTACHPPDHSPPSYRDVSRRRTCPS
jgi:integrase